MSLTQGNAIARAEVEAARPVLWAIGGGKGGVGKSFISTSMGVALAKAGKRVILVDLDLGGANLHTSLGIRGGKSTLYDYLGGTFSDINHVVEETGVEGLSLVGGAGAPPNIANLQYFQKAKLLRNLRKLDADYVVLDLGAGTSINTLDFFLEADHGLVSVTPDPSSVENAYRFLKCVLIRRLRCLPKDIQELINDAFAVRREIMGYGGSLANIIEEMQDFKADAADEVRQALDALKLHIIVNQVVDPEDAKLGNSIQAVCQRYFGARINYLGYLHHDPMVLKSLQQRRPFLVTFPRSRLAIHLGAMVASLMGQDDD